MMTPKNVIDSSIREASKERENTDLLLKLRRSLTDGSDQRVSNDENLHITYSYVGKLLEQQAGKTVNNLSPEMLRLVKVYSNMHEQFSKDSNRSRNYLSVSEQDILRLNTVNKPKQGFKVTKSDDSIDFMFY